MSQLIRMLGDSSRDTENIDNIFKESIKIPARAKVSLAGGNAILADNVVNERFLISAQDTFKVAPTIDTAPNTITIPSSDSYTAHSLLQTMTDYANYRAPRGAIYENYMGYHAKFTVEDGRMQLQMFANPPASDADFDTWLDVGAAPPATADANNFTAGAADTSQLYSPWVVPMMGSQFSATLTNPDTIDIQISASLVQGPVDLWGLRSNGGNYEYALNGTWNDMGLAANAGDAIIIQRYGGVAIYTIAGTPYVYSAPTQEQLGTGPLVSWIVTASANGALTDGRCTQVEGGAAAYQPSKTKAFNVSAAFTIGSKNLATYLGFTSADTYIFYGNPATLKGRGNMQGGYAYPGILVVLDNMGILPSHDGAAPSEGSQYQGTDNILYVFHDLKNLGQQFSADIPQRIPLNLNNSQPMTINRLRLRLLEAANGNVLAFTGKPCFTLIIEE